MAQTKLNPSVIFETSWEVCNKVGGIYTVLSSRANTLQQSHADKVFFIGPDVWQGKENPLFKENKRLLTKWKKAAAEAGVNARIGRRNVPGAPIAILVDFQPFFDVKNDIYAEAWDAFQVDSLHAYGDYDEASMFSYAAGKFVEAVVKAELLKGESIIYQAHEWMSGLGMLFLKKECPEVATIFTTHATSIGRSIAGNNKLLYKYFHGYNGDQMAAELSMEAKHSIEKQSAHGADCFTTVSMFTDRECKQLLDKPADVVLPNGFENDFVPKGAAFTKKRKEARQCILNVASKLIGEELDDTTLIVSTSGRNDFRCKGFDVYMEALAQLNARMKTLAQAEEELVSQKVLALIEVPCWTKEPRQDLLARLNGTDKSEGGLHTPMITHDLHNLNEDRILCLIKQLGLWNTKNDAVKVILVPCYLEGADGIFNMPYYDLLTANDLCLYPSYYEPWGYTPLESCAFKAPCITTDLSGFGQWVNDVLGYQGELSDGVKVIHRDDDNYFDVSREMCEAIEAMMRMPLKDRATLCKKAAALADKAQWKNFIKHYFEAYDFALRNK
jgi:glycogen synthase